LTDAAAGPVEPEHAATRVSDPLPVAPWLVIVNPVAGRSRRDARAWRAMEQALRQAGLAHDIQWTTRPGDGARIAADAWQQGRGRFLVAGGDGSVHDVVNGLMAERYARGDPGSPDPARIPTVVPLPLGTGNDWSRSLDLPGRPAALAAILRREHTVPHDVGRIEFPASGEAPAKTCWFINVAGAGFDAHVIERMPARTPSRFAYLAGALRELARYRSPAFKLTADDDREAAAGRLLLALIANGRYCGGRMHVAPTARQDDGAFDLVTIADVGLLRALPKLAKLYVGNLLHDPLVTHRLVQQVRIDAQPVAGIEADGQLIGRTPAVISVQRGALRTLRGPRQ
jgi:YegS/Rv2252/BmrU family lipid kinase